jgi:hypothetical protein
MELGSLNVEANLLNDVAENLRMGEFTSEKATEPAKHPSIFLFYFLSTGNCEGLAFKTTG